jgi:L-aspartate oxidase
MSARVVIVGGGLAGLFTALKMAPRPVTVLAAARLGDGASSAWAQGGIAAALTDGDTPQKHTEDTLRAGGGLVDAARVLNMAREAQRRVDDLLALGVPFDRDLEGHLLQSKEAAHSERRIVRVKGDRAGKAIMEALVAAVHRTPSIRIHEELTAERIEMVEGRVAGLCARTADGHLVRYPCEELILATGGAGFLYALTTNPAAAVGTGLSMAARVGAEFAEAEFVQFHPTAIDVGLNPAPLATEALRGEGAWLVNQDGRRFMPEYHRDAELAPRDVVARAVFHERAAGRGAYLDCRAAIGQHFATLFPTVYAACQRANLDPARERIPIAPAAHYHMGGIVTNELGQSSIAGLWAVGEVAASGVHGANRLASNSLLEAVVFGARIAEAVGESVMTSVTQLPPEPLGTEPLSFIPTLQQLMSEHVGVVRDELGLQTALVGLGELSGQAHSPKARAMLLAAALITTSAQLRRESRGAHFRSDFPTIHHAAIARQVHTWQDFASVWQSVGIQL